MAYQYAEMFFHLNPRRKVTVAIPGFKTLSIPLDAANEFIERDWGVDHKLSEENDSFSGQADAEAIYNELAKWGIDINKNLTVDFDQDITSGEELEEFFVYLRDEEQEEQEEEREGSVKEANYDEYISRQKGKLYIDREDVETGDTVVSPGERINFTYKGTAYSGIVSEETSGRDDDMYELIDVEKSKK